MNSSTHPENFVPDPLEVHKETRNRQGSKRNDLLTVMIYLLEAVYNKQGIDLKLYKPTKEQPISNLNAKEVKVGFNLGTRIHYCYLTTILFTCRSYKPV